MGISGLLPALKPIHVTKHLEEYSGKTLAIDAYVWLHKGLFSCATELATGKKTHKYVDYAMHRVRLLRHYNIHPYIVFDGGPLPAKKGTENDRNIRREENLAKGKTLTAQGKHSQARECYVKCVDVTPQMAFQFIKALKAEDVPYVVAPYEADAQLAYLEKIGLADAILTEDSDLLVFGCRNVLYKLDVVANTVISISRDQFGSVCASASDPNSISLYGWSDAQFRAMAILSGCDYLPSIPGVGLKTANTLLRRWKTAEQVIRAITLEGKKSVPTGYPKYFQLAELCFLHQRAYCPLQEKLVHLTDVGANWNKESDDFVGSDIDPVLARSIALGDACPISHLPMTDIDPGFIPRPIKRPLSRVSVSPMKSKKKAKMRESLPCGGILNFFGPNPIIPPRSTASKPQMMKPGQTGKASGKRTLVEVMENDLEQKKKQRKAPSPSKNLPNKQSKFFSVNSESRSSIGRRHSEGQVGLAAGPSRSRASANKENAAVDDIGIVFEPEWDGSELSLSPQVDESDVAMSIALDEIEATAVLQEEGYISPSPSCSRDAQDLSSPLCSDKGRNPGLRSDKDASGSSENPNDEGFNTDILSSPIFAKRPEANDYETPMRWSRHGPCASRDAVLVGPTSTPTKRPYDDVDEVPSPTAHRGPDLRKMLDDGITEWDLRTKSELPLRAFHSSQSSDLPDVGDAVDGYAIREKTRETRNMDLRALDGEDEEQAQSDGAASRMRAVMAGWQQKWALSARKVEPSMSTPTFLPGSRESNLRRSETTVNLDSEHGPLFSTTPVLETVRKRPRLTFLNNTKSSNRNTSISHPISNEAQIRSRAQEKLSKYRYS